jgi:hypothetical protein
MFRMQTASDVRKLMVHQIRCKGPTLLKWVQTWSLASLNFERILDPENTGTTSFSHYRSKADIGNVCFAPIVLINSRL